MTARSTNTEAELLQLLNVLLLVRQIKTQFRELDRDVQDAILATTGELSRALHNHDPYGVAVAIDAVEDLIGKKESSA